MHWPTGTRYPGGGKFAVGRAGQHSTGVREGGGGHNKGWERAFLGRGRIGQDGRQIRTEREVGLAVVVQAEA